MAERIPYGGWPSEISAHRIARGTVRQGHPQIHGGEVFWLEARPAEGGRQLGCSRPVSGRGAAGERSPAEINVRSRVHEYGGGDYLARSGELFYVDFATQRLFRHGHGPLSPLGDASTPNPRYADLDLSPDGRWLLAVEERPCADPGREPSNRIVAFRLDEGTRGPRVVAEGHDFYSFPRFSPDGRKVCFTSWEHPDMPWDRTVLHLLPWSDGGPAGSARQVAGEGRESIFQPGFSPAGVLTFISDRSGWWNLYQLRDAGVAALCPMPAEFGAAQWVFGMSRYAFESEGSMLCIHGSERGERMARLALESGQLDDLDLPYLALGGLHVENGIACFWAGSGSRATAIATRSLADGRTLEHATAAGSDPVAEPLISVPEAVSFPSRDGRRAHAYFYRPTSPSAEGPAGERPPLLVKSHGGPTSCASPALDLRIQFWTSRGFAVVDVDYGGSSGHGRAYRELLHEAWGVVDVEDCTEAALWLARDGRVDPNRLAISGGSAGGYTTLCALTFEDVFHVGASHYGIGDLEALLRDTHKFEARYLDGLIGPYPQARARYVERSPIHHTDRLSCPVIFFQGLEDRVVPPNQAEAMVEALARKGIAHAYVPFEGEQHGFRRAENIATALDGELYFYGQVFGFAAPRPAAVQLVRPSGADH